MLKNNKKFFALLLSLIMIVYCLPINIFAIDVEMTDVIVEEESLREENVKHFKMPDGSYTAVVYSNPVHRKDSNGVWQDIDNRMNESTVKNKQAYVTADGRATFSKKINSDDPTVFELSENGYSIKVSFADSNIKNTTAKLSNHATKYVPTGNDDVETQYKKLKTIDNNTTISYKNLLKGMTLEYVLSSNDVKENIVIEKAQDAYDYSFTYELVGLVALLNEDGSISLIDEVTEDGVYVIPAPYMYDAEGETSYDVSYTLTDLGNGKYTLTVSANSEWINDAERSFPVVIDPTLTFEASYWDTYINSADPDVNYGSSDELWISSTKTTFIDYDELPELPENATISRATLNMYYYYYVTSGSLDIGLYLVYVDWLESTLTWNVANQNTWMGIIPSQLGSATLTASSSITETTPGLASINVTDLVQAWYAGMDNFGMALKYEGGSNGSVILKSWDAGEDTAAYYEITYTTSNLLINNGTYRIRNLEYSDKYMQIDDQNTVVDGAFMELWDENDYDNQKWVFEYLHNGYYKITSAETGKALTAPNNADDSLTQTDYSLDDEQLWKVTLAGTNLFKLSPKSNTSYYMAAGDGVFTSDGRNVEMRTSQSDNKDEWIITSTGTKAIFILPGILGSSLAKSDGTDVWLNIFNYGGMALEEDGTSVNSIVSINKDNYGANDTYDTLYNSLKSAYGDDFDVVFFDYDFRLSIDTAANKLAQETEFYDEVILVAHSMGGLVASKYLANSSDNRNKTTALITLGTPFAGSAKCINVMETGEIIGITIGDTYIDLFTGTIKAMSKNCFSSYQLLPTSTYYSLTNCYPLIVNGQSYSNVYSPLKNTSWGKTSSGTTKIMFNKANSFHNSLKNSGTYVIDRNDVNVYTIAGTNVNTISQVILDENYNIVDLEYSSAGDGTVMTQSAGYGSPDYTFSGVNHMGLVTNSSVINTIKSIITQTTGVVATTVSDVSVMSTTTSTLLTENALNSNGWADGYDNRRINLYTSLDAVLMVNGSSTSIVGDTVYDCEGHEIGSMWLIGASGRKLYALYDGAYTLSNATFAKVEYMNNGYYDKIEEYDALNGDTIVIDISNYNTQMVVAQVLDENSTVIDIIQPTNRYSADNPIE